MADLSQILQAGLMNYGQPNGLDKGLMSGDPSMQLGMQLLANSNTPGNFAGIFGRSMLGTQEAQQKNAQQQLALMQQGIGTQQAVQMFPYLQSAMQQAFGTPGQPQGQQDPSAQGAPSPGAPSSPASGTQSPTGSPQSMANLGAMLGLMGRPGGQQLIDAAKFQTDNDPAHATQMAVAKGDPAQDLAMMQDGLKNGNLDMAKAAYTKYLADSKMLNVSAMSGDVTTFGGISPQSLGMSNFNPARGTQVVNGVQSPIPGAPGTQQALAGAQSLGEAAGKPFESTDASGMKTVSPLASVLGGGPSSPPAAGRQPAASTPSPVPPKQAAAGDPKLTKALADPDYRMPVQRPGQSASPAVIESRNKLMQDSSDATTAAGQSLQYLKAAQTIMTGKGAPSTALPGEIRAKIGSVFGTVNATNYQEVAKYLGNAALANARSIYGPRMTQKEVGLQLDELSPSLKMTDGAIKELLDNNIRNAQYTVDTAHRARAYVRTGNDPMSFGEWNQQYFPHAEAVNKPSEGANTQAISGRKVIGSKSYYQMNGKWYAD